MKHSFAAASVLACAMSLASWSGTAASQAMAPVSDTTPPAASPGQASEQTSITPATSQYIEKAAQGDLFEIQSSELALKQAEQPEVRDFAERMAKDHAISGETLKAALEGAQIQMRIPTRLDQAHEAKLSDMRKLRGRDFDQAYMAAQITAHQEALQQHKSYVEMGDNPVLRNMAANMAVIIEEHLDHAQSVVHGPPQTSSTAPR